MHTDTSRDPAISLKKLIAAELLIFGFCIWLTFALQSQIPDSLWYQSTARSLTAWFILLTFPGLSFLRIDWHKARSVIMTFIVSFFAGAITLTGCVSVCEINSTKELFPVAMLAAITGLLAGELYRRKDSLSK